MELEIKEKDFIKSLWIEVTELYNIFWGIQFLKDNDLEFRYKKDAPEWTVIKFQNKNKDITIVYIMCSNKYELFVDWIYLPTRLQNRWILKRIIKSLISFSKEKWIKIITTRCSKDNDDIWYFVFPLVWFNWLYNSKKLQLLWETYWVSNNTSILDFYTTEQGKEIRKQHWRTFDAEFDITNQ